MKLCDHSQKLKLFAQAFKVIANFVLRMTYILIFSPTSNIRHKDFRPSFILRHAQGTAPWILKRGGLESSG